MSAIVTVSSKGQITLPVATRKIMPYQQYLLEKKGNTLVLSPVRIEVIKEEEKDFSHAAESSLGFWNNAEEDLWDTFYNEKTK